MMGEAPRRGRKFLLLWERDSVTLAMAGVMLAAVGLTCLEHVVERRAAPGGLGEVAGMFLALPLYIAFFGNVPAFLYYILSPCIWPWRKALPPKRTWLRPYIVGALLGAVLMAFNTVDFQSSIIEAQVWHRFAASILVLGLGTAISSRLWKAGMKREAATAHFLWSSAAVFLVQNGIERGRAIGFLFSWWVS